ncbi:hypothetical protein ACLMAJ_18810 [Nocardia sp. KC 131]
MDTKALAENHDRLIHEREYTRQEAHSGRRFAFTPGNSEPFWSERRSN